MDRNTQSPKDRSYEELFSLCETCLSVIPAHTIIEGEWVFYEKDCPLHGLQKTRISTDVAYFMRCRESLSPNGKRTVFQTEAILGCPLDCGLCPEHEQEPCVAIIEILDDCNLECPTCIATSHPGAGNIRSLADIVKMMDLVAEAPSKPILMISGGEPTIHPDIVPILKTATMKGIEHVMLITNGVIFREDPDFAPMLGRLGDSFEVYLQFDSLSAEALVNIRGKDLREVRLKALEALEVANVSTTLVCVAKNGVNDGEYREIIEFAMRYRCVRGVTFQPVRATGRNETFDPTKHLTSLTDVRSAILSSMPDLFEEHNFIPNPSNPENISISYLLRKEGGLRNVTNDLYGSGKHSEKLRQMMYFLPSLNGETYKYNDLFRVTIVAFLDKYSFSVASAKRSSIHFVTSDSRLIPADAYYLFYQATSVRT